MKDRIYVCHTYYHVYVTFLKEFALPKEELGKATILLSSLSTDFETLKDRLEAVGIFEEVIAFDEKPFTYFEELLPFKEDKGNLFSNLINRMKFTKKFGKLEEEFIPVDMKEYKERYVFCDSDPIGYYLNYKHIPYHALEDGINCLKIFDAARYDNRGHFKLKAFLSSLNLIFIQNGYGKYCIDMEINDKDCLKYDCPKYVVLPRKQLEEQLTKEQKSIIVRAFVEDADQLLEQLSTIGQEKSILILTEQLCSLEVREQIFKDIIEEYGKGYHIFLKVHPRDEMDYEKIFPEHIVLKGKFPLEVLNHIPDIHFEKAISVFTQAIYSMDFVDEKVFLGEEFMDKYEDPEVHRYNDKI